MTPYWASNGLTLLHGDCRDVLRSLLEKSVQCCMTSPPYWGLRSYEGVDPSVWGGQEDYCPKHDQFDPYHEWGDPTVMAGKSGGRNQDGKVDDPNGVTYRSSPPSQSQTCQRCGAWRGHLGFEPTPELYVQHIVEVFREVWRVLRDDGTLWLNLGDSYAASGMGGNPAESKHRKQATNRGSLIQGHGPLPGLKPKDLVGIPWRCAFALQADGAASPDHMTTIRRMISAITGSYDSREEWPARIAQEVERLEREWIDAHRGGWHLRSAMPWVKRSAMPESVTDRPTSSLEYVFLLTKKPHYYFDMEAVRVKAAVATIERDRYSRIIEDDGPQSVRHDHETQVAEGGRSWRNSDLFFESIKKPHGLISSGDELLGLDITAEGTRLKHFASFPEKLVATCLKAGTSSKGRCPECGTAWRRVVEKERTFESGSGKVGNPIAGKQPPVQGAGYGDVRKGPCIQSRTVGWQPGCECVDHSQSTTHYKRMMIPVSIPCTVIDPFIGSGTTLAVAKQLGLHGIGIDASATYLDMARRRIENPRPEPDVLDLPGQFTMFQGDSAESETEAE